MASFSKAVGGCPTNIAIGTARLGLKSGLITRVGDEHMGRFIREQCAREGVDVAGIKTDPARLTSLVLLGIRDDKTFPLIFYRENCADSALDESDIDEAYIACAKAIVVTGTHFARPNTAAAQNLAIAYAKKHGRKVAFDIDYRPNLWGLAGHGAGEERYIKSDDVSQRLQPILAACDLIVGTEEEVMIAGGVDDPLAALRAIRDAERRDAGDEARADGLRRLSRRDPRHHRGRRQGAGLSGGSLQRAGRRRRLHVRLSARLAARRAAGDLLRLRQRRRRLRGVAAAVLGRIPDLSRDAALSRARLAASRAAPRRGAEPHPLGDDAPRRSRPRSWRSPSTIAPSSKPSPTRPARRASASARSSCWRSRRRRASPKGGRGFGMLLDGRYGREALFRADELGFWIGRPVEAPGSRPLEFEFGGSLGAKLIEWPLSHTIKCLCFYRPDDSAEMKARQERELLRLYDAARRIGRELLIEIIAGKHGAARRRHGRRGDRAPLRDRHQAGLVEARRADAGRLGAHRRGDRRPAIRYVAASWCWGWRRRRRSSPRRSASRAARARVKGFAVGRTIFVEPARRWFAGQRSDEDAVREMAEAFARLCGHWEGG